MTEKDLALLVQYHKNMLTHHKKMLTHFAARRKALRRAVAKKQSERITTDILEKLKSN